MSVMKLFSQTIVKYKQQGNSGYNKYFERNVFSSKGSCIHAYRTGDLDRQFQKQRKCSFIYEFCKYSTLD
ncbi:unnamed protein product [Schistosoma haematobium]|nr:unnamed protein product [Schistosoma haematobium]